MNNNLSSEDASDKGTMRLLEQYPHLIEQAEMGNITSLCIKIDLDRAIDTVLTKEERECITLYLIEGYTYEEVRKKMGISNGTARNRVGTGIRKITEFLKYGGV